MVYGLSTWSKEGTCSHRREFFRAQQLNAVGYLSIQEGRQFLYIWNGGDKTFSVCQGQGCHYEGLTMSALSGKTGSRKWCFKSKMVIMPGIDTDRRQVYGTGWLAVDQGLQLWSDQRSLKWGTLTPLCTDYKALGLCQCQEMGIIIAMICEIGTITVPPLWGCLGHQMRKYTSSIQHSPCHKGLNTSSSRLCCDAGNAFPGTGQKTWNHPISELASW